MRRTIKITALAMAILAFFMFVGAPLQQAANAIAVVDDAFLAVVIAALAALGIIYVSTGGFQTVKSYVNNELNQFAISQGTSVNGVLSGIQTGSNNLGQILLNNRFVEFLQAFATFIINSNSLVDNDRKQLVSSSSSVGGIALYDLPCSFVSNQTNWEFRYEIYTGTGVYWFMEKENDYYNQAKPYFVTNYANTEIKRIQILGNGQVADTRIHTLDYHYAGKPLYGYNGGIILSIDEYVEQGTNIYPRGTFENLMQGNSSIVDGGGYDLFVDTGVIETPHEAPDYNIGDGALLDVGAAWGMTYDNITYRVIPGTYEDSTITYDTEADIQEQVTDTPQSSVSDEATDYQSPGLQNVFPFCIPFDIYAFFECLAADPVAPSFTWRFYVPGICDEEIELDLSEFDSVAQIVRTMELLAFIVGLALVTRDKFLRG